MNITTEQAKEILELMGYVAVEVWGNTRTELDSRTSKIKQTIEEGLRDIGMKGEKK